MHTCCCRRWASHSPHFSGRDTLTGPPTPPFQEEGEERTIRGDTGEGEREGREERGEERGEIMLALLVGVCCVRGEPRARGCAE